MVMPMHHLIDYSNNYAKTSGILWLSHKDDPYGNIADSKLLKSKARRVRRKPAADNTIYVKLVVPVKYLGKFWRTLKMSLINCEVQLT